LDNLTYILRAPVFAEKHAGQDGRLFYGEGLIKSRGDMGMFHLPDPREDAFWDPVERFIESKGDYSAWLVTRMGIMPTMLSMGTTAFSLALFDDRAFVEEMFDRYLEWTCIVAERASQIGFDAFATTDDVAFGSTTFFSPRVFRDLCMDRYRELQRHLTIPWVYHSDGNMMPFMKDLVTLNVVCFHPMERGAMDPRETKQKYGDRLCLMGNVDLNTLGMGTPDEVEEEVKGLIRDMAPGGGYILASGNSLAGYLIPRTCSSCAMPCASTGVTRSGWSHNESTRTLPDRAARGVPDRVPLHELHWGPGFIKEVLSQPFSPHHNADDEVAMARVTGVDMVWTAPMGFTALTSVQLHGETYVDEWGTRWGSNEQSWPAAWSYGDVVNSREDWTRLKFPTPTCPCATSSLGALWSWPRASWPWWVGCAAPSQPPGCWRGLST